MSEKSDRDNAKERQSPEENTIQKLQYAEF